MYSNIKFPICNGKPERAPKLMGHTFVLCWRCSMTIFSVICNVSIIESFNIMIPFWGMILGGILLMPMLADGIFQYFADIPSSNFRRALTGFLFGTGVTIIVTYWCP